MTHKTAARHALYPRGRFWIYMSARELVRRIHPQLDASLGAPPRSSEDWSGLIGAWTHPGWGWYMLGIYPLEDSHRTLMNIRSLLKKGMLMMLIKEGVKLITSLPGTEGYPLRGSLLGNSLRRFQHNLSTRRGCKS